MSLKSWKKSNKRKRIYVEEREGEKIEPVIGKWTLLATVWYTCKQSQAVKIIHHQLALKLSH